jgi:3-phenylpropionate/cinnamic acid dioxygenase small subunit
MIVTVREVDRAVRDDVTDVLVRYATGIDTRDWPLLRTCFTDDCDADYGDIGHWRGGDEIVRWMAQTHDPLGPTMHRITNVALGAHGGGVTARSYVHAVVMTPDGAAAIHAFGWYDDDLVTAADGWRIARRRFTSVTTEMHSPMGGG